MSTFAVIGAGKTGRGFVARLLAEAGQTIAFVDRDARLVSQLNERGSYTVRFFGDARAPISIANYTASTWEGADFADVDVIFVSVGGTNLAAVGQALSSRLDSNKPYYIITCENAANPAVTLQEAIALKNVCVSEATVFCTTIEGEGIDIRSEDYPYLQFDAARLKGYVPIVPSIKPIANFGNFLTRKLFTYNAASCVIAYMGWYYGHTDYAAAANDPRIAALADRNYEVTNRVLCREFGYDPEDQREFALLSRKKFRDRTIVDTIQRNARDPLRKLGPRERVIGPMTLIDQCGEDTTVLETTAAAMLLYDAEGEDEWRAWKETHTPEQTLCDICQLPKDGRLTRGILSRYAEMVNERQHS